MSFQAPIPIAQALTYIEQRRYLLPAIQREFEWPPHKIEWLFDSLMRGYPISSFLFWEVQDLSKAGYKFYEFLRDYREQFKVHNEEARQEGVSSFTAVLDGQQRLTSLYIGLKGSYAWKEKGLHWVDSERNIPTRHLYLNISSKLEEQEDGREFEFSFLKMSDTAQADLHSDGKRQWFRVSKINDLSNIATFNKYLREKGLEDLACDMLARLHAVVFTELIINFFLEREQDLQKALNIFIRINSGGIPLDFSDLIMSIAVANWSERDARKDIHQLVDRIREVGFWISKDFIFKAYLYLYSSDIKFKVTNFTQENAHNFEKDWERIRDAIEATFMLVRSFGYTDPTLVSKNAIIPILYYLYHTGIYEDFNTSVRYKEDRATIQRWLHVMLLKRVFGIGGADGTLSKTRRAFTDDVTKEPKIAPDVTAFPVAAINGKLGQDVSVGDEFIEDLLKTQKDNRYAFSILALLRPQLDYRNNDFHKDHLHPISSFSHRAISKLTLPDEDRAAMLSAEWNNSIINLQMLDANENKSKQAKSLAEWVDVESLTIDRGMVLDRCLIPQDAGLTWEGFFDFAKKRKDLLKKKLMEALK